MNQSEKLGQLMQILHSTTMDIPEMRKNDFQWLLRNLAIRNSKHPDFIKTIGLIKDVIKGDKQK